MKFNSPIYDRIRVKPDQDRRRRAQSPVCEWTGCGDAATHRAPKGRGREHEYWRFCLDHVREYNHSYNFFAGMTDEAEKQERVGLQDSASAPLCLELAAQASGPRQEARPL